MNVVLAMNEIELKPEGVHITKEVEVMGALREYSEQIGYDELNENRDLNLEIKRIEPDTNEDGEFIVRLKLSKEELQTGKNDTFDDLPSVPEVPKTEVKESRWPFYRRLKNPERQPFDTRRLIYEEGELTERELKELMNQEGYTSIEPGKQNGSLAATLVVLDEVTNEIERHGTGEDKLIKWAGES